VRVLKQKDNPMSDKPIPAIMPAARLPAPKRTLKDLKPGDSAFIGFGLVALDQENRTFVKRDTAIHEEADATSVKIILRSDGGCTLILPKDKPDLLVSPLNYALHSILMMKDGNMIPVVEIREE
jgi:hypothetical protein